MIDAKRIETERLILRRAKNEDALSLYENWDSDVEMHKYVGYDLHTSIEDTRLLIEKWIKEYDDGRLTWMIVRKDDNEIIGVISASNNELNKGQTEIGFSIGTRFQGKGYATESIKAIIKYLLIDCNLDIVNGGCYSSNIKSAKVMMKAGMKEQESIDKEIRQFKIVRSDMKGI